MTTLLFKIWDGKKLSKPFSILDIDKDEYLILKQDDYVWKLDECEWLRFSGEYDANDKPIFEGDIVTRRFYFSGIVEPDKYLIKYCRDVYDENLGFHAITKDGFYYSNWEGDSYIIIGNKYEMEL